MAKKPVPPEIDVNSATRTPQQSRIALLRKTKIFYDLQRLRLQTGGRTLERAKENEIQLNEVDLAILGQRMDELHTAEKHALKDVENHLNTMPFYRDILSDKVRYRGIGPTMAGVIMSAFDIFREETPSQMWAFAGLRPMPAMRCKQCHAVVEPSDEVQGDYVHKATRSRGPRKPGEDAKEVLPKCLNAFRRIMTDGTYVSGQTQRPQKNQKLPYNSFLRSKLCGVLGPVMLKLNSPWRKFYDDYKHRKTTDGWGQSDMHRHNAAIRYLIKMLLQDIWLEWRKYEGLPIREPYHIAKQGGHGGPKMVSAAPPIDDIDPEVAAELENLGA